MGNELDIEIRVPSRFLLIRRAFGSKLDKLKISATRGDKITRSKLIVSYSEIDKPNVKI